MAPDTNDKDVLYIDVDDDITTIIDKVRSSEGRVVALVLPKRATVLQSIVNMKLLKRSAESAKKHAVLVTTEPSIMPLAATVGLHVAATPQSKPGVPIVANSALPVTDSNAEEAVTLDDEESKEITSDNAGNRPVGDLSSGSGNIPPAPEGIETLTLPEEETAAEETDKSKKEKLSKDKKLKVPSFNKFRKWLVLAIIIILLIIGLILALTILPRAAIAITTKTSNVNVSLTATLNPSAQSVNTNTMTVPAQTEQQQQTTSQQVTTTGQQNNGTAATGSVTMSAGSCTGSQPDDVPAGTGLSASGLTYITQSDTTFTPVVDHGGHCTWQSTGSTNITAQSPGTNYNTSGSSTNFTVADNPGVTATGSASGGTDNIIQVVAQSDIDNAKQKLASQNTNSIKSTLEQQLKNAGFYPLTVTFSAGTPNITTSSNVGDHASTVTVTQAVTYTMYGARRSNLDTLISSNVDSQISTTNQEILDDGLSGADIGIVSSATGNEQVSIETTAVIGPDINITKIKKQVEGKKIGSIQSLINQIPGVTNVNVHLSPFWVSSVPTNPSKVTITLDKSK
ncbi:MAG: hypothetical protein ACREF5_02455 [Candidatus Saccharimonadales bacterium]